MKSYHNLNPEDLAGFSDDIPILTTLHDEKIEFLKTVLLGFFEQPSEEDVALISELLNIFYCRSYGDNMCYLHRELYDAPIQLAMWREIALNHPRFTIVIDKTIILMSIPASEASVERCFSCQKRILTRLRTRTSRELLPARFWIMSADPGVIRASLNAE
jgi:hypothetical protein